MNVRQARSPGLPLEDERYLEVHAVAADLAALDGDLLLLDPRASDVLQGLIGPGDSEGDCIFEALAGLGRDLGDSRDAHGLLLAGESRHPTAGHQGGRAECASTRQ